MSVPFSGDTLDIVARLAAATLIGGAIGVDREMRRKPAGLRTHALVSLGSAIVMLSSIDLATTAAGFSSEPVSRAVQGIIVGIGFLGGGVIVKGASGGSVHNLTTAASIWVVAGLGLVCGAGQWVIAITAVLLALAVLRLGGPFERLLRRMLGVPGHSGEDPPDPDAR